MRNLKATLFLSLFLFPLTASAQSWYLAWSDEFSGNTVNTNNWTFEQGGHGWGNNELQYYTSRPDNVQIINDHLAIIAKSESYNGRNYTSTRMITKDKQSWQYGRIEARIKIPKQQGLWPAFWALGQNFTAVGWPKCGEMDIMEHINTDDKIHGTIHWDAGGYATYGGDTSINNVSTFNDYSIEWNTQKIRWYVNGIQYHVADIAGGINSTQEFHQDFFLILNMAVGGNWPGNPSGNFVSDTLWVDYVRVYKYGIPANVNEYKSQQKIVLLDLNGRNLFSKDIKVNDQVKNIELSIPELKSGIYLLRVENEKGTTIKKLSIIK